MTDQEWADFRAEIKRDKDKQAKQERALAILVKQSKAESGSMVPVLTFRAYGYDCIALVQIFEDSARISRFTDIGPMGHLDIKNLDKLAYELKMEGFEPVVDSSAIETLEAWISQPKWEEGLKAMQITATTNTLYYHGYGDQANEVMRLRNPSLGYRYCKEFGLKVY